jgi:general secretion pathway protein N
MGKNKMIDNARGQIRSGAVSVTAGLIFLMQSVALAKERLVVGALGEDDPVRPATEQAQPAAGEAHENSRFEPLANLAATRDRPIFSPSRRPPPVIAAPAVVAAPPPPKPPSQPLLSLVGAITAGEDSIAIFLDETTKAVVRVKAGEQYGGWTLTAVQGREATLQRDELSAVLALPGPPAR